jgi:hypothetical protein
MNVQRIFSKLLSVSILIFFSVATFSVAGNFLADKNSSSNIVYEKTENKILTENPVVRNPPEQEGIAATSTPDFPLEDTEEYAGPVRHIFFHSLIIYPEKALADTKNIEGYKANMITVEQFKQVLQQLYENNFVLIDAKVLYSFDENGTLRQNTLYVPKGKKPLIVSVDDLSYYSYMKNGGFAHKLVVEDGRVKTEVLTPEGKIAITDDGDVVPIVDSFVKDHPDFSFNGAKGIIGVTGFEGILGYRTNIKGERGGSERQQVVMVAEALKKSGWTFASHSFSHNQVFLRRTITADFLADDISRWAKEIEPLVGRTNIFIGPFGQVFSESDPRRQQLIDAGFTVLYGVGMDGYTKFFDNHIVMNRTDIDGYRLTHNAKKLYELFGIAVKADF